jgi:peptidoglycan/xylan/chitin deacetylase (PgdA/CDA1 family)
MDQFVPIIAYHRVNDFRQDMLTVNTELFHQQMSYLKKKGYQSINLDDLVSFYLNRDSNLPDKPIVITFDDGFQDNYLYAFPILNEFGFKATFFLILDLIGTDIIFEKNKMDKPDLSKDKMLSWNEIKKMHEEGMKFGAHTCSHTNLLNISQKQAEQEIFGSYSKFVQQMDYPPLFFCYPYGVFDEGIKILVKRAGFRGAVVTPNCHLEEEDLFALFRVGIYGHNNLQTFKFKISKWFKRLQKQRWYWSLRAQEG